MKYNKKSEQMIMDQIIIQVKDHKKAKALVDFLRTLDFVNSVNPDLHAGEMKQKNRDSDFFALAGIWAKRDITIESIRRDAWPNH
jgi:hypothetical protein